MQNDTATLSFNIRMPRHEHAVIKAEAIKAGMPLSEYARRILYGELKWPIPRQKPDEAAE